MRLLTTKQMRAVEAHAINDNGVPSLILMENAARGAADEIIALKPKTVAVLASSGNNGGDGLAVARLLMAAGISVSVFFTGDIQRATLDCSTNLGILKAFGAALKHISDASELDLTSYDIVVDALIGTGLKQRLSDKYIAIVNKINEQARYVVSIDCPTGVNSDNGRIQGAAVKADLTVTFHLPKCGLMLYPAYAQLGRLAVKHIGIPYTENNSTAFTLDKADARALLPERSQSSHKGTYGKVLFVSGSELMAGAAIMNVKAAYRVGAGLVNVCTKQNVISVLHTTIPEAVTSLDIDLALAQKPTAAAIGSGIGKEAKSLVVKMLTECTSPLVIDADAINIIAENKELLSLLKPNMILTPHLKEMSRLIDKDTSVISEDMINIAQSFASEYNVTLILKNAHSVIAAPNKDICINTTGCSAMSKGGSGDTLTGAIAGLLSQGLSCYDAACLGAYLCGKAGELCADKYTQYGVMATECADALPEAIAELLV